MPSWEFPAEEPVSLRLRLSDGTVTVSARPAAVAALTLEGNGADGTRVGYEQGTLSVIAPDHVSLFATVELPEGSSCTMNTASADIRFHGQLGTLDIHTASGDVSAERVNGAAEIVTASGDIALGEGADIDVKSASGDTAIGHASGVVSIKTASGDVAIAEASGHRTEVISTSGDISVGVAPGAGVYLDLWTMSGAVNSELDPAEETAGADMTVRCRSISGDVRVSRAAAAASR